MAEGEPFGLGVDAPIGWSAQEGSGRKALLKDAVGPRIRTRKCIGVMGNRRERKAL